MAERKRTRVVLIGCLVAAALAVGPGVGGLMVLGLLIDTNVIPDTEACPGAELPQRVVRKLVEHDIVEADETILYFYSEGLLSHLEDGNLFTDRRVISYERVDGGLSVWCADYPAIEDIDVTWEEGWLDNTVVTVVTLGGEEFQLWVSNEGGRDEEFVELLMETWERERER